MTAVPVLAAVASQTRVSTPLRPSAITGWASQTPGSSGVQSRCGARPLVQVPAPPFINPGIQSAWVPAGVKTPGAQRGARRPVLDTRQSPHGPADLGAPKVR